MSTPHIDPIFDPISVEALKTGEKITLRFPKVGKETFYDLAVERIKKGTNPPTKDETSSKKYLWIRVKIDNLDNDNKVVWAKVDRNTIVQKFFNNEDIISDETFDCTAQLKKQVSHLAFQSLLNCSAKEKKNWKNQNHLRSLLLEAISSYCPDTDVCKALDKFSDFIKSDEQYGLSLKDCHYSGKSSYCKNAPGYRNLPCRQFRR